MTFEEYTNLNKDKLKAFCENYFIEHFNSDRNLITEDKVNNLLELIAYEEKESKRYLMMALFDYLDDLLIDKNQPIEFEPGELEILEAEKVTYENRQRLLNEVRNLKHKKEVA